MLELPLLSIDYLQSALPAIARGIGREAAPINIEYSCCVQRNRKFVFCSTATTSKCFSLYCLTKRSFTL